MPRSLGAVQVLTSTQTAGTPFKIEGGGWVLACGWGILGTKISIEAELLNGTWVPLLGPNFRVLDIDTNSCVVFLAAATTRYRFKPSAAGPEGSVEHTHSTHAFIST